MYNNQARPVGRDERVQEYLLPVRIMMTKGHVTDADTLLVQKERQIGLAEAALCTLSNAAGEEKAGILLDFGCEFHGGVRLLSYWLTGGPQVAVRLCFGESAAEALSTVGEKNATNDHALRDMVVQLSSLSDAQFGQTGYRFLYIELVSEAAVLPLKAVMGVSVYLDLPYIGSFSCDDPRINAIYRTAAYTCHLCMQTYLWDGIKRDRLVWVGDMHPEMLTIRTLFGTHPILEKSLQFAQEQAPLSQWMNGMEAYSLWWLIIVRDLYVYSGDAAFAEKNRDYIVGLVRQIAACIHPDGTDTFTDYFFDWQTRGTDGAKAGVHALLIGAMQAGQKLAQLYHSEELAALCREKLAQLQRCIPCDGGYKQVKAMLALVGAADREKTASALTVNGAAGLSTFTSYYVLKAVSDGGCTAEALSMLKEYYGAMLDMGATTFWENFDIRWLENAAPIDEIPAPGKTDIHGDHGAFCYQGFRHSLCHGWSSGPVPFLTECVLGIRVVEDGCRKIQIHPSLGHLKEAHGTFPTPYGVLKVSHRCREDGTVETQYTAPDGVAVEVM